MSSSSPESFAAARRAVVVAPAGCGKTELIARAIASATSGRDLLLTHTHAGVRALRDRLKRDRTPARRVSVDTIAGWCLRFAASYPSLSGLPTSRPTGSAWNDVYGAAARLLQEPVLRRVIQESYSGIYVDEYQDCTRLHHAVIQELASLLPCRVVGDPLQGIFGFGNDPLVDWDSDVFALFERLPDLGEAWRWRGKNEELGDWLLNLRKPLIAGEEIDLARGPLTWCPSSEVNQNAACLRLLTERKHSIVAIQKWPAACHAAASRLNGAYSAMEPMECPDLLTWAKQLDSTTGPARAVAVIDGAKRCFTALAGLLKRDRELLDGGMIPTPSPRAKYPEVTGVLALVATSTSFAPVLDALHGIEGIEGTVLYRRELWAEMKRTVRLFEDGGHADLWSAAWACRDQARISGRRVDLRTVSRTLLVKGLEFDHAIVLAADDLTAKELYVALTRGSRSLTVLSRNRLIRFPKPTNMPAGV